MAGQADGIQPRTIEVLQVGVNIEHPCAPPGLTITGDRVTTLRNRSWSKAIRCTWSALLQKLRLVAQSTIDRLLSTIRALQAASRFVQPSTSGLGTDTPQRTGRAADVTAPTARYPFEVRKASRCSVFEMNPPHRRSRCIKAKLKRFFSTTLKRTMW